MSVGAAAAPWQGRVRTRAHYRRGRARGRVICACAVLVSYRLKCGNGKVATANVYYGNVEYILRNSSCNWNFKKSPTQNHSTLLFRNNSGRVWDSKKFHLFLSVSYTVRSPTILQSLGACAADSAVGRSSSVATSLTHQGAPYPPPPCARFRSHLWHHAAAVGGPRGDTQTSTLKTAGGRRGGRCGRG